MLCRDKTDKTQLVTERNLLTAVSQLGTVSNLQLEFNKDDILDWCVYGVI